MTSPASPRPPAVPFVPAVLGVPATPDGPWRDLDPSDRIWAGVCYTRTITAIDLPGAERVRAALLALARSAPELGRWVTGDQARWRPVRPDEWDAWLDAAFVAGDERSPGLDRIATLNAAPPSSTQFRVMAGPDWLSVRACHSMGDGWSVDHLSGALLAVAQDPAGAQPAVPWQVVAQRDRDRLIRREVRAHTRAALWALRHRAELAGGVYEPIGADLAPGREHVLERSSPQDFPRLVRSLRDELFPGVSAAAVGMVGLRAALAAELGTPRPGFECLFNTRDAAAGTASAWGNFSAGIFIRPVDDYAPSAVAAEMQRVRASGLPEIAHASLRMRGRRTTDGVVAMPRAEGAPRMTMSYLQSHTIDPVIAGLRPYESRIGTVSRPNGADSVSVQQVECAGRTHVAISCFPQHRDPARVATALDRFFADPRGCLLEPREAGRP